VEVVSADAGRATRVTISGRQQFVLPPLAEALRLDLQPDLQAALTAQAYAVFAERTFANFEAVVEGRLDDLPQPSRGCHRRQRWNPSRDCCDSPPRGATARS